MIALYLLCTQQHGTVHTVYHFPLHLDTELTFFSAVSIRYLYSFRTRGDGESFFLCKSLNSSSISLTEEEIDRTFLCRASSRKRSSHLPSTFKLGKIPSPWEPQGPVHRQHGVGLIKCPTMWIFSLYLESPFFHVHVHKASAVWDQGCASY